MKNLYKSSLAALLLLLATIQLSAQTYCTPTFNYTCTNYYMDIANFSTTGSTLPQISNLGVGCSSNVFDSYSYFSNLTASAEIGASFNVNYKSGPTYNTNFGFWVDWNHNGTFESTEFMFYRSNVGTNTNFSNTISVPLTATLGKTRMRIISDYYYYTISATDACTQNGPPFYYGECQDYNLMIYTNNTTPVLAGFAYDIATDTAWINNPYIFVNTSNGSQGNYWDVVSYSSTYNGTYTAYTPPATNPRVCATRWNTCYLDTVDQNFTWRFPVPGYYKVKLKATNVVFNGTGNATGSDSVTKIIVCAYPTQKPSASFFSVNTSVGFTDQLNYYDLSTNGPTAWSWFLNPTYYGINTFSNSGVPNAFYDPNSTSGNPLNPAVDTITQNPYLYAFDGGVFDVCLAVGNSAGWDTLCRHNYLTVNNGYLMCNGSDSVSTLSSGYVYDNGGPTSNYTGLTTGNCPAGFRINACADTVLLSVERFKLHSGDSLTIRIGNPTGLVFATLRGGPSLSGSNIHYKIPGGAVFFNMYTPTTSPGDSGFAIRWTIVPASYGKPKASFAFTTNGPITNGIPSVYIGYTVRYTNTSTGINVGYSWDTNGDGIFGTSAGGDSINANPSWKPSSVGTYNICLKAYNCIGEDLACNKITVLPLQNKPTADMTVNKTSGFTTDTFRFYDASTNGATSWQWSFSPANVSFLSGTNANSQNPILFLNSAICYTVTLKATNILGSNTKVIPCMVNVLGYNSPGTAYTIPTGSDIGISRVTLGAIDTTTALQTPVFTQMNNLQIATLYRGVSYSVSTYRLTNNDPMTTRVWIDWNMNANFTDLGETIINEKSQNKISTSQTFKMPDNNPTGNTRMRVGISYDSTTLTPNMSQLGCFEDYGIYVGTDYVNPVISLVGPAVYKMQVGKYYTEYGITATDNLEGDISSRYVRTGYLDTNTIGYYTLTYTVADLYGNVSLPVTRVVQVEIDRAGPTIALIGKDTAIVEVNYNYTEKGAIAMDNQGRNISNLITSSNNVNTKVLGTDSVIYSITDAYGITATIKRTVIVVDTYAPIIKSINGKFLTDNVRSQIGTPFVYQNFLTVTDNYWTNLQLTQTGSINVNVPGSYTLLFNTTDGSGNQAITFRLIVKIDNTILPVITLIDLADITVDVNTVFTDPGVTYSSSYYAFGTLLETTTSTLDMTKLGTYTITYCVTDPSGNKACITRTIHVVDRIAPVIYLNGDDPYVLPRYQAYVDPGVTITDNYYPESVLKLPTYFKPDYSKVRNDLPGIYYVTFNDCDPSLNCANAVIRTVRVVDMFGGINTVNTAGKMKIYPNPNNGKFTVELENGTTIQTIKVYSIIGSLVKDISVNGNTKNIDIDMSDVNEGIYIVKIDGQSGSFTQKINIIK